jgi:hypothetical protein
MFQILIAVVAPSGAQPATSAPYLPNSPTARVYVYDGPSATTTPSAETGTEAQRARSSPRTSPGVRRLGSDYRLAAREGADAAKIIFGHGARHLAGTGLDEAVVNAAIKSQIEQSIEKASATGSFWGRVTVDGQTIEYRAYSLPGGTINVGTYYVPK